MDRAKRGALGRGWRGLESILLTRSSLLPCLRNSSHAVMPVIAHCTCPEATDFMQADRATLSGSTPGTDGISASQESNVQGSGSGLPDGFDPWLRPARNCVQWAQWRARQIIIGAHTGALCHSFSIPMCGNAHSHSIPAALKAMACIGVLMACITVALCQNCTDRTKPDLHI